MKRMIQSLRFQNVNFSYNHEKWIFFNLSFDFPTERIVFLKGRDGVGCSTLLKLLAGIKFPQDGQYLMNGEALNEDVFADYINFRRLIGYTFDYGGLMSNLTLEENLKLPLNYHNIKDKFGIIDSIGEKFKIKKELQLRPAEVSQSINKLITIMRAIMLGPELLLLDDPFSGLSKGRIDSLSETIYEHWSSKNIQHVYFSGPVSKAFDGDDTLMLNIQESFIEVS